MIYMIGGAPRVGKTYVARRLAHTTDLPWFPTDIIRTVLRRSIPSLDALDQGLVDPNELAAEMALHIATLIDVCKDQAGDCIIEGIDFMPDGIAKVEGVRACFLGSSTITATELQSYAGSNPWHLETVTDLNEMARWINSWSVEVQERCLTAGLPYLDVNGPPTDEAARWAAASLGIVI